MHSLKSSVLVSFIIMIMSGVFLFPKKSEINDGWHNIGKGNLGVMQTKEGYLLYPNPVSVYGDLSQTTNHAYILQSLDVEKIKPVEVHVTEKIVKVGQDDYPIADIKGILVDESRNKTRRLPSGEIITSDIYSTNLWIIEKDMKKARKLLDDSKFEQLKESVYIWDQGKGEDKIGLDWAFEPVLLHHGEKIAYFSNKNSVSKGIGNQSVLVVDSNGLNERVLINAEKYGGFGYVGAAKDTIVVNGDENIITGNVITGKVKEFDILGRGESVSPDGKLVLFRKIDPIDNGIFENLNILDLETGKETRAEPLPKNYFYNTGGDWSPDGLSFAFYGNGYKNIDDSKPYSDNNVLVILDTITMKLQIIGKPTATTALYPLGSIQWLDSTHILTYSADNNAWLYDRRTSTIH